MSGQPLVSVIIPAYRCAETVKSAIDSALAQDVPLEVLVIDDCPEAPIDDVMSAYSENPVVTYLKNPGNLGAAETRNRGIRMAKAPYVAFLDADDVVCRNAYTSDVHDLLSAETYDLISFDYYCADQDLVKGNRRHTSYTKRPDGGLALDAFKHCGSFLYLRSLFAGNGGPCFPEGVTEYFL